MLTFPCSRNSLIAAKTVLRAELLFDHPCSAIKAFAVVRSGWTLIAARTLFSVIGPKAVVTNSLIHVIISPLVKWESSKWGAR
jgi:hypothetical protein